MHLSSEETSKFEYREKCDPLGDEISSIELIRVSGSDLDVVNAARVSFGKISNQLVDRDKRLIKYLITHNHTSPFEHNQLSFRIKAPMFVVRQWMRHRMNSYNEISYRYVKAPEEFYVPPFWRYQDTKNRQGSVGKFHDEDLKKRYKEAIALAQKAYHDLLEAGIAREIARGLLPLCAYTEFIFTCNLHSLMHFMCLRLEPGAQYEIRCYAKNLLKISQKYFPVTLEAWSEKYKILLD